MKAAPSPVYWAKVGPECPWTDWWPLFCQARKWPADVTTEKWMGADLQWSEVIDSAKTFSLFTKFKALVIFNADKALKAEKSPEKILSSLSVGPHRIVFVADQDPPKSLKVEVWENPLALIPEADDKAAFRWIDSIHARRLSEAVGHLESALRQGSHPFALLQLVGRDFRLGRLILHAKAQRLREQEIIQTLKVNPYALKKW